MSKASVKWSIQTSTKELGDSVLQTRLAEELWRLKDKSATSHFVAAENPTALWNRIQHQDQEIPDGSAKVFGLTLSNVNTCVC